MAPASKDMVEREHWTIDKRIPAALIVLLLGQFAFGIWAAAQINADVNELKRADTRIVEQSARSDSLFTEALREQRTRIEAVDIARNLTDMRLIRVEEQTRQILDSMKELQQTIRIVLDRGSQERRDSTQPSVGRRN